MRIFGHDFNHLDESHVLELFSLEREGAIYTDHWIDSLSDFRHISIAFSNAEITEYVRSMVAYEAFLAAGSPDRASDVPAIPPDIAERADNYSIETRDGETLGPPWHCPAAFIGPDLEDLVCFTPESRRLILEQQGTEALITTIKKAVDALTPAIRRFSHRKPISNHGRLLVRTTSATYSMPCSGLPSPTSSLRNQSRRGQAAPRSPIS